MDDAASEIARLRAALAASEARAASAEADLAQVRAVVTTSEPNLPSQGHVLSWDSFHFEDESLFGSPAPASVMTSHGNSGGGEISINIDMTNQVLDQIPPTHDI